jgi:hypothetical protein
LGRWFLLQTSAGVTPIYLDFLGFQSKVRVADKSPKVTAGSGSLAGHPRCSPLALGVHGDPDLI